MKTEEIASKIKDAEQENKKIAMFHFLCLTNADEYQGVDAVQFCRDVGVRDSFATEFRKMISLSKILKDEGYVLEKVGD